MIDPAEWPTRCSSNASPHVDASFCSAVTSRSPPRPLPHVSSAFSFISLQMGFASGRPIVFSTTRSVRSVSHSPKPAAFGACFENASETMSRIDSPSPVFHTRNSG